MQSIYLDNPREISVAWKVFFGLGMLIASIFSSDATLFLLGMFVFVVLVNMFYNRMEPPILLFSAVFGWFFFQGQMFNSLARGEDIITIDYFSQTKPTVIALGLIAVLSFFVGLYLTSRGIPPLTFADFRNFVMRIRLPRLFLIYTIVFVAAFMTSTSFWMFSGLAQPIFVLSQFKWAVFFLLFVTVMVQERMMFWLFVVIVVDMGLSLFSFFSHFKEVIYFSFLSYWIFYFRTSIFAKFLTLLCLIVTFYLGAYWSAIKEDYRNFLNRGTGAQAIRVSREEAYSKLGELVVNVQTQDVRKGIDELLTRLSWIGAFDAVYNHVPSKVPHEEGDLWAEGISRPFLPRLFFPNKRALTDSKELNYYSGLDVDEKTTSISLSLVAGSYVDFGKYGMHVPIFLFGLFCGWVYKRAVKWGRHPIIGYAAAMPMIYLMQINEQSINRIVSSVVLYFIVLWFLSRFALNTFLRFILAPESKTLVQIRE